MRNWDEGEEQGNQNCSVEADFRDAERVCQHLAIPLHTADFVSAYWTRVFTPFVAQVHLLFSPNWAPLIPALLMPLQSYWETGNKE